MTEREYYRETETPRRDVYEETTVEPAPVPADDVSRDVYHERVASPYGACRSRDSGYTC